MSESIDYKKKVCKTCKIEKPVSEFQKAGGGKWLQPYCKPCDSERKRQYSIKNKEKIAEKKKQYYIDNFDKIARKAKVNYEKNKDSILKYHKEYGVKNKAIISEKTKKYRAENTYKCRERDKQARLNDIDHRRKKEQEYRDKKTPEQKLQDKEIRKQWAKKNADKIRESRNTEERREWKRKWAAKKSETSPSFRIEKNIRSRIRMALNGIGKADKALVLLGCSVDYFKGYLESLFTEGMNWGNQGLKGWHIDHKKPCSKFDLTKESEQRACFHYTNQQPMWWEDNLKKSNKYSELTN